LRDLARSQGVPILMVTHDPRILDIADRIVAMEDGRILPTTRAEAAGGG
jgi:putative ABC transport system ATP-binding protein